LINILNSIEEKKTKNIVFLYKFIIHLIGRCSAPIVVNQKTKQRLIDIIESHATNRSQIPRYKLFISIANNSGFGLRFFNHRFD